MYSAFKQVVYCSKRCQVADWKENGAHYHSKLPAYGAGDVMPHFLVCDSVVGSLGDEKRAPTEGEVSQGFLLVDSQNICEN